MMNWNNVTIEGYVNYYRSLKWETGKDVLAILNQNIWRAAYLLGITPQQAEELTPKQLQSVLDVSKVELPSKIVKNFRFNGRRYKVDLNPTEYDAGRYMSVMNACKDNAVENLHRILFVVCREVDWLGRTVEVKDQDVPKRIEEFKKLPLKIANPIAVFFWSLSENLTADILRCSTEKVKEAQELIQQEIDYMSGTGG